MVDLGLGDPRFPGQGSLTKTEELHLLLEDRGQGPGEDCVLGVRFNQSRVLRR